MTRPQRTRWARRSHDTSGPGLVAALGVIFVTSATLAGCAPGPLDAIGLAANTLSDGLLAHYTFDEGSGVAVIDHSGNKRDGVLTGGTWIPDGQFGGALHFSGGDFVTVENFPNATSSFSVSAWVRSTDMPMDQYETVTSTEIVFDGGWQLNLDKTDASTGVHTAFWDTAARAYTYYECPCLPVGQWTHLASVVDGVAHTLSLYVAGQLKNVAPAPHAISPGSPILYVGRWSDPGRHLVGDVDDIAIYSRALVSAEIAELGLHPPPDPN